MLHEGRAPSYSCEVVCPCCLQVFAANGETRGDAQTEASLAYGQHDCLVDTV